MVPSRSVYGRVYTGGVWAGGYGGGLYRGTTQPSRKEVLNQRSGPVGSCREPEWWVQGRVRPSSRNPPSGPGRYGSLVPGPLLGQMPPLGQ